jgi:hypothetical protein
VRRGWPRWGRTAAAAAAAAAVAGPRGERRSAPVLSSWVLFMAAATVSAHAWLVGKFWLCFVSSLLLVYRVSGNPGHPASLCALQRYLHVAVNASHDCKASFVRQNEVAEATSVEAGFTAPVLII